MQRPPASKIILVILAIAVLAVIGYVIYSHRAIKNVIPPPVSENTPVPTTAAAWPSAKVRDETITDNASYYDISAVYPVVKDDVISGYFKTFVQDSITQFKSDTSWAAGTGADAAPAEAGDLSLDIKYTEAKGTNADNFIFSTTSYEGGAHGLEATKTFTFSSTGQLITIPTLFTNGDAGLSTISDYVKAQLMKTLPSTDQSFVADGTAPTEDNYASFTVGSEGLTFIFDPYQVAPYSDGQQTVKVPLSVFKSIANPDLFASNAM